MSLASRQKRVGLHLPLDVDGRDAGGDRFKDKVRTLNVSGGGLAFETVRDLQMGSRLDLRIELPAPAPPLRRQVRVRGAGGRVPGGEAPGGGGRTHRRALPGRNLPIMP